MTHEQKIEALSNKIREALPYLMKVEEGQIFFNQKSGYFTAYEVRRVAKENDKDNEEKYCISGIMDDNSFKSFYYPLSIDLIGKEPLLNDVLAWLIPSNSGIHFINIYGMFCDRNLYYIPSGNLKAQWNLEKPYLKDQSAELIDFLYSLIDNEN